MMQDVAVYMKSYNLQHPHLENIDSPLIYIKSSQIKLAVLFNQM